MSKLVAERTPDLAVLDLQIGFDGRDGVTMALRLDEIGRSAAPRQGADAARPASPTSTWRSAAGADGWLIKPLDPLRLKRASLAVANDEIVQEGVPVRPARRVGADRARRSSNARGRTSTRRVELTARYGV